MEELRHIADSARCPGGRRELAENDVLPQLLLRLQVCLNEDSPNADILMLLLRAMRNLCAGEELNQNAFVKNDGVGLAASLARKAVKLQQNLADSDEFAFNDESASCWLDILKLLLQVLGNVAGVGEAAQEIIWKSFFPDILLDMSCVSTEAVRETLSMVLYTCCRSNINRCDQLANEKGARLMAILLRDSKLESGETNKWLSLLVEHLCMRTSYFPALFTNVGASTEGIGFSSEQVLLLNMMHTLIEDIMNCSMHEDAISKLVEIIEQAARSVSSSSEMTTWPTGFPNSDVLGLSLSLSRLLCANENDDAVASRVFTSLGFVQLCLGMLRALGPPEMIKKALLKQEKVVREEESEEGLRVGKGKGSGKGKGKGKGKGAFPRHNPYRGYRRDLVAVVGNMSFRNREVQEEIRENGGLVLVLQQCVVDDNNPYLREWGLWAIRNLTDGNEKNVEELAKLEMERPVDTEEVLQAGLKVVIDPLTSRPKLINT